MVNNFVILFTLENKEIEKLIYILAQNYYYY